MCVFHLKWYSQYRNRPMPTPLLRFKANGLLQDHPETLRKSVSCWFAMAFPDPPGPRNSLILEFGVIWSDITVQTHWHTTTESHIRHPLEQIVSNSMCRGLQLIYHNTNTYTNVADFFQTVLIKSSSFNQDKQDGVSYVNGCCLGLDDRKAASMLERWKWALWSKELLGKVWV